MSRGAACCAPTYYVGTPLMSAHIGGLNARPHARHRPCPLRRVFWRQYGQVRRRARLAHRARSEEHTSELQSQSNLVCRLLLEKKEKPRLPFLVPSQPTSE